MAKKKAWNCVNCADAWRHRPRLEFLLRRCEAETLLSTRRTNGKICGSKNQGDPGVDPKNRTSGKLELEAGQDNREMWNNANVIVYLPVAVETR